LTGLKKLLASRVIFNGVEYLINYAFDFIDSIFDWITPIFFYYFGVCFFERMPFRDTGSLPIDSYFVVVEMLVLLVVDSFDYFYYLL
jgi:hypothetical protein